MAQDEGVVSPRKGKLSAFALLKSWLFDKRNTQPVQAETEFLNTRDGYELAKFAQKAFGGDAEARKAHEAAVAAEQAEIDELLRAKTDVVAIHHAGAPQADAALPPAAAVTAPPVAAPPVATPQLPAGTAAPSAAVSAPMPMAMPAVPGAGAGRAMPPQPVAAPAAAAVPAKPAPLDLAVKYLEKLREQGLSVETLAEALIIIESRDVKKRNSGG